MDAALFEEATRIDGVHWWFQGRRRIVASVLRRHLAPGQNRRIFDARCRTGEMTDMLREFGSVSAIDPSPEAVDHCRARFGDAVDVRIGEMPADLPPPGEVDVVAAFDALEELKDDRAALQAIHRALRSGGTLVVTADAFEFLWGPHDELCEHRRRYGRRELRERLEAAGFTAELVSYFNAWLFPAASARAVIRRFRGWKDPRSDFVLRRAPVNRALLWLAASEAPLVGRWSPPAGTSLVAVARKP